MQGEPEPVGSGLEEQFDEVEASNVLVRWVSGGRSGHGGFRRARSQLSSDARSAIPHDVQQMVVIDYRIMQNSSAAMELRGQVMPPELKQLEEALKKSGLNDNNDLEQLAFILYRTGASSDDVHTVGIAQGQFPVQDVLANFKKKKVKATTVRSNKIYPDGQDRHERGLSRRFDNGLRRAYRR
jgi:hypothetical protein